MASGQGQPQQYQTQGYGAPQQRFQPQGYGQQPQGASVSSGGIPQQYQTQGFGPQAPGSPPTVSGQMMQPQNGAGGYNPQPMSGYVPGSTNYPGVPQNWQMTMGSPNSLQNTDAIAASMPGAPPWLQKQMGDYYTQPMYAEPNQWGRWSSAQNMQGGGPPSPFGQYAQQQAQYPQPQFPAPAPPAGAAPPTAPPPGSTSAPPPGPAAPPAAPQTFAQLRQQAGGLTNANLSGLSNNDLFSLIAYGPNQQITDQARAQAQQQQGGNYDSWLNSFSGAQQRGLSGNDNLSALYGRLLGGGTGPVNTAAQPVNPYATAAPPPVPVVPGVSRIPQPARPPIVAPPPVTLPNPYARGPSGPANPYAVR